MDICFEGIGQMVATFATKDKLAPGMAVTLTGNGEVGLGEDGVSCLVLAVDEGEKSIVVRL